MLFFLLINVKMPTIVGILTFISSKNFMLRRAEHEFFFITSGHGYFIIEGQRIAQIVLFVAWDIS